MTRVIRLFVLIEGITFIIAALTHFGVLIGGYEHHLAGRAESVIGIVLLAGLALTWIRPAWTRGIGLAVQAFALFGTFVGIFTIVVGIGPRTVPDVIYHVCIVIVLVSGLIKTAQSRADNARLRA
ncbi:MAG TPA: hypothetical protein VN633_23070 [Bryobacteraceae bacterium]|jgi:hypothetical protein|nr:hypothetical protein [Bryobacteraceae bacterium]